MDRGDEVTIKLADNTFVAVHEGVSGTVYVGAGHDRAEALRSLADDMDPLSEAE